ncbi:MAG: transposase zinc-binding domain-containing protein [Myxococcaceae bacterium]|nr:transposase zinc-binding domain-containing protein [Myxococcaceae bacterium]
MRCGDARFGFVEVSCDDCHQARVVAFCCKGRGWCPSCTNRRAVETGVRLAALLPWVRHRQWSHQVAPARLEHRRRYCEWGMSPCNEVEGLQGFELEQPDPKRPTPCLEEKARTALDADALQAERQAEFRTLNEAESKPRKEWSIPVQESPTEVAIRAARSDYRRAQPC